MSKLSDLITVLGIDADQFSAGLRGAAGQAGDFGGKIDKLAGLIFSPAGMVAALGAVGVAAFQSAEMFDESFDQIRVATGATGTALEGLEGSFKAVFAEVPNEAAQVSTAISELNQRLGLTGEPLEKLATQFLNLAYITKTDVGGAIAAVAPAFNQWKITTEGQSEALDYLFRVSQSTGAEVDSLAQSLVTFGPTLQQMGFDFQSSAALLGLFEQQGIKTDNVLGSLTIALRKMAQEGITEPSAALPILIERIRDAGSVGESNRIAVEAFGRSGTAMAAAIRSGALDVAAFTAKMGASGDTINAAAKEVRDFGERWTTTWHKVQLALLPVGEGLRQFLDFAIGGLGELIKWATPVFKFLVGGLQEIFRWLSKIPGASKVFASSAKETEKFTASIAALTKGSDKQSDASKKLTDQLDKLTKTGLKEGKEETKKYEQELRDWNNAASEAAKVAGDHWEAVHRLAVKTTEARESMALWEKGIISIDGVTVNYIDEAYKLSAAISAIETATSDVSKALPPFSADIQNALNPAGMGANSLSKAMSQLGLDSTAAKQTIATEMAAARDEVLGSNIATDFEKKTAIYRALKAQVEAAQAAGRDIPPEQLKTLTQLETDLNLNLPSKVLGPWKNTMTQVSTAITNAAQSMVGILIGTEEGSISDAFKKLGQGVLSSFIEPVLGYINDLIEWGIKKLIGWILGETGLGGAFKSLGGLFGGGDEGGGGGGVGGAVGGATGGLGGGGGGGLGSMGGATAIGSMFGPVGMAIGAAIDIGTAIMGVVGGMRREGTLNAIEENTRFAMIFNLATLDQTNTYLPYLKSIHERWVEFLKDHAWRIHDVWEVVGQLRDMVRDSIIPPIGLMAAAGAPTVNVYVTLDGKQLTAAVATEIVETLRSGGQQL